MARMALQWAGSRTEATAALRFPWCFVVRFANRGYGGIAVFMGFVVRFANRGYGGIAVSGALQWANYQSPITNYQSPITNYSLTPDPCPLLRYQTIHRTNPRLHEFWVRPVGD
jgi:hypothetical protein